MRLGHREQVAFLANKVGGAGRELEAEGWGGRDDGAFEQRWARQERRNKCVWVGLDLGHDAYEELEVMLGSECTRGCGVEGENRDSRTELLELGGLHWCSLGAGRGARDCSRSHRSRDWPEVQRGDKGQG